MLRLERCRGGGILRGAGPSSRVPSDCKPCHSWPLKSCFGASMHGLDEPGPACRYLEGKRQEQAEREYDGCTFSPEVHDID